MKKDATVSENKFDNCFGEYQLFAGKFAEESVKINIAQAKNTPSGITYRIPTLLDAKADGSSSVLAMLDLSESGGDYGRIQVVCRRSTECGETFDEMKTVLSLPVRKAPQKKDDCGSAFAIDPVLVQCRNGDILMIVDMYPECKGIMRRKMLDKAAAYETINDKRCLRLYSGKTKLDKRKRRNIGEVYTVREDHFIYTPDGKKTAYYLPPKHSGEYAFETVGDMYYAVGEPDYIDKCPPMIPEENEGTDIYCGNIFLSCGKGTFDVSRPERKHKQEAGPDKNGELYSKYACVQTEAAPLSAFLKSSLWVLRSTDGGKSWSTPLDITGSVMRNNEFFLGTGPGVALCLKCQKGNRNGRILVPVYNLKKTAVVYSDDNGMTWKRSESSLNIDETQLVELSDGTVMCFGRQRKLGKTPLSISTDGGVTWKKCKKTGLSSVRCQKSLIRIPKELYTERMDKSKDYIIASHPSGNYRKNSSRFGGMLTMGVVNENKSITWLYQRRLHADAVSGKFENFFAYSCLAALSDGTIGVMYEALPSGYAVLEKFTVGWLCDGEKAYTFPRPLIKKR